MPPRTIDNLGVEVSTRYAQDQKQLDQKLIKESRGISTQTEIDVTTPSFASELDILLELQGRTLSWADFYAPTKYNEQKKRLFTYQTVPSLGTEDKKESQAQKILAKIKTMTEKREKEKDKERKGKQRKWEEDREIEEEEKEKETLIALFHLVATLDKFIIDINSRRGQYQKG
ncbi:MAG TPA: DUF5399 family protein [Rhabdochlamydiaceae bacterium]|nr:DUF5399 family protein [Rhabdochlamydiaceae bacterium]